jgi:hypothetical protein
VRADVHTREHRRQRSTGDCDRRGARQHRRRRERDDGRDARVPRREPEPALRAAPHGDSVEVRLGPTAAGRPLHELRPAPRREHGGHRRDPGSPIAAREQRARGQPAAEAAELHHRVDRPVHGIRRAVHRAHHAFFDRADFRLTRRPPGGAERAAPDDHAEQVAGASRHVRHP